MIITLPLVVAAIHVGQLPTEATTAEALRQERLQFMKEQAAEFEVFAGTDAQTPLELTPEPLPQPLHRYADEKAGILDGSLFAFVIGNDPEHFSCWKPFGT